MADELKVRKESTFYVDAFELARFLSGKIGKSVQVVSANDETYSSVIRATELPKYDVLTVTDFIDSGRLEMDYSWSIILTHAVNEGWIEPGNYVVEVSW